MFDLIFGKGNDKILLTKAEYRHAKSRYKKRTKHFGSCGDSDGDGFLDFLDTHPNNPKKHSLISAVVTGAATTAGSAIVAKILKNDEVK